MLAVFALTLLFSLLARKLSEVAVLAEPKSMVWLVGMMTVVRKLCAPALVVARLAESFSVKGFVRVGACGCCPDSALFLDHLFMLHHRLSNETNLISEVMRDKHWFEVVVLLFKDMWRIHNRLMFRLLTFCRRKKRSIVEVGFEILRGHINLGHRFKLWLEDLDGGSGERLGVEWGQFGQ